jgi:hypothetical protein
MACAMVAFIHTPHLNDILEIIILWYNYIMKWMGKSSIHLFKKHMCSTLNPKTSSHMPILLVHYMWTCACMGQ